MTDDIDNDATTLHESGGVGLPGWHESYRAFRADYDRYNAGNLRMPFSELRGSLDLLIGELDAALAASPLSGGWRPIETAPKDGTVILLADKSGDVVPAAWNEREERFPWSILDERTDDRTNSWKDGIATHWMPLPAAPTTEDRSQS